MSPDEVLVVLASAAAIAFVNLYFFRAGRGPASAAVASGGRQEVEIRVEGGYDPTQVRVRAGTPVRLLFDRRETSSCSEEVVLPDFGIRAFLPAHETTAVDFLPTETGTYTFTCGMGMLRGRVIVEAP